MLISLDRAIEPTDLAGLQNPDSTHTAEELDLSSQVGAQGAAEPLQGPLCSPYHKPRPWQPVSSAQRLCFSNVEPLPVVLGFKNL